MAQEDSQPTAFPGLSDALNSSGSMAVHPRCHHFASCHPPFYPLLMTDPVPARGHAAFAARSDMPGAGFSLLTDASLRCIAEDGCTRMGEETGMAGSGAFIEMGIGKNASLLPAAQTTAYQQAETMLPDVGCCDHAGTGASADRQGNAACIQDGGDGRSERVWQ